MNLKDVAIGSTFTDATGRMLVVEEIRPGDPSGREVIGTMISSIVSIDGAPYSCDEGVFDHVWIQKKPPANPDDFDRPRARKKA